MMLGRAVAAGAAVAALAALAACEPVYVARDVARPTVALDHRQPVLISVPRDASYGAIFYRGSGTKTARAVQAAFRRHASQADMVAECGQTDCLILASQRAYGYFVRPEILHWEDRATYWSGRPDRVEVRLTLYDLATGLPIASHVFAGAQRPATAGRGRPEDLLAEPLAHYLASLYR